MAVLLGSASASITLDIAQFMGAAQQAQGAMTQLAQAGSGSQPTFFDRLKGSALGLGTALVAPMALGISAAIDLEQSLANVDAALGNISDNDLGILADQFNDIAIASQYSATEVAAIGEGLAKAGFDQSELGNVTEAVVLLAQATGEGLEPAMRGVVAALAVFDPALVGVERGLTDATRVADILTVASNNSTASLGDLNAGLRPLLPLGASLGMTYNELAASVALFTNYGLPGADAGLSLARGLQNLADPTSEATALMDELGIAAFDLEGNFVGFPTLFDQLKASMGGMSDEAQLLALSTIFGAEAIDVMGLAILEGGDPLRALIALTEEYGTATEQSAIRMDTLGAALGTLKEGVTTFLGSLVQGLIPGMRLLVDGANVVIDALMKIPAPIKTVIGAVAGLLALFAGLNIGIGAFSAITGAMSAMGIGAGVAGLSLGALVGVIGLIGVAVGGLYLAWETNFLGMRDIVTDFIDDVTDGFGGFFDRFFGALGVDNPFESVGESAEDAGGPVGALGKGFDALADYAKDSASPMDKASTALRNYGKNLTSALKPGYEYEKQTLANGEATGTFGRALGALSFAIRGIQGEDTPQWLERVADGLDWAAGKADIFERSFRNAREEGLNPFQASMVAVADTFPGTSAVIDGLGNAFDDFMAGDYAGGFATLGNMAESAAGAIADALGIAGDLIVSAGSWVLDVGVPTITGWIVSAAGNVWDAITTAAGFAWGGLVSLGGWTLNTAIPTVSGWITDAAGNVWNALKTAAGWAGGIIGDLGAWTMNTAAPAITGWVRAASTNVWNAVKGAVGWAGGIIGDLGAWTLSVPVPVITGWVAGDLWEAIKTASGWAWTGLQDLGAWTLSVPVPTFTGWTGDVGGWVADQIGLSDFTAVETTTRDKITAALSAAFNFGTLAGGGIGAGVTGLGGIAQWLADQINAVDFSAVGNVVGQKLGQAITVVMAGGVGFEALKGAFFSGISTALGDVSWDSIGMQFWNLFEAVLSAPTDFATGVIEGLGQGLLDAVDGIDYTGITASIVSNLSGSISAAEGFAATLGTTLQSEFSQSVNVVDWGSLASNIGTNLSSAISGVTGFAQGLGGTLFDEFSQALANVDWGSIGTSIKDALVGAVVGIGQAIWDAIWGEITGAANDSDWNLAPDESLPEDGPLNDEPELARGNAFNQAAFDKARLQLAAFRADLDTTKLTAQTMGGEVSAAFDAMAGTVGVSLSTLGSTMVAALANSAATATMAFTSLFNQLPAVMSMVMTQISFSVVGGMNTITAAMANGAATATTAFSTLFNQASTVVTGVMTRVQFAIATAMNSITAAMANGGARATQTLANALAPIPGIVQGVGTRAQFAAVAAGNGIANGFGQGADKAPGEVSSALSGIPGIVASIGGRASIAAFGVGQNIASSLASGIRSGIDDVRAAAAELSAAAIVSSYAKLQANSPSKVYMNLGEYVGEGFALGIRSMIPTAALAASDLVSTPRMIPGQYATPATYGGGSGAGSMVVNVTVEGNVTTERDLTANVTREIGGAIRNDFLRHRTAAGVS